MKTNITLIGMPAVGKSTVGVILAKILGYRFEDTDLIIQQKTGKLLSQIIEENGPDGFIGIENDVIKDITAERTVIATGGSAVYGDSAMKNLKSISTIVYLQESFDVINARLQDIKSRGVVLKQGQSLHDLYEERVKLYKKYADVIVDEETLGIESTVNKIIQALKTV